MYTCAICWDDWNLEVTKNAQSNNMAFFKQNISSNSLYSLPLPSPYQIQRIFETVYGSICGNFITGISFAGHFAGLFAEHKLVGFLSQWWEYPCKEAQCGHFICLEKLFHKFKLWLNNKTPHQTLLRLLDTRRKI